MALVTLVLLLLFCAPPIKAAMQNPPQWLARVSDELTARIDPLAVGSPWPFRLLIVGDSSAAGVGVRTQAQALAGHLSRALASGARRKVHWQLVARSGITTAGYLGRSNDSLMPAVRYKDGGTDLTVSAAYTSGRLPMSEYTLAMSVMKPIRITLSEMLATAGCAKRPALASIIEALRIRSFIGNSSRKLLQK